MKRTLVLIASGITLLLGSCSKDDNKGSNCMADAIALTQTEVNDLNPSSNAVIITFDAKNTSSANYNVANGSKPVYVKVIVTTTDNSTYESSQILTVTSLSAGSTASTDVLANYGTGKTYKSYTITKYCQ